MSVKVILELDNCSTVKDGSGISRGCPYSIEKRTPNSGYALDYFCKLAENKMTSGYVEWIKDFNPVPEWCPLRSDHKEIEESRQTEMMNQVIGAGI